MSGQICDFLAQKCPDGIRGRPPSGAFVRTVDLASRRFKSVRIAGSSIHMGGFCPDNKHIAYVAVKNTSQSFRNVPRSLSCLSL